MTTWLLAMAAAISARLLETGNSSGNSGTGRALRRFSTCAADSAMSLSNCAQSGAGGLPCLPECAISRSRCHCRNKRGWSLVMHLEMAAESSVSVAGM